MTLTYIKSTKSKDKLSHDNFLYVKDQVIGDKIYWKCENVKTCKARVHVADDKIIKLVNGIFNGHVVPLIFCLLPNKKEMTYVTILRKLKELEPNLNPKSIMLDYEMAQLNAFKKVFPDIQCRGCIFHMNQSFFR